MDTITGPAARPFGATRPQAALAGAAAAAAALGTGELLSGLRPQVPSLVLGVADLVVDEAPGDIVRWSIDTFGSDQKAVLVTGIVLVSLLVGAALGIAARDRFRVAAVGFAAFGVLGGWAAARGASSNDVAAWVAAAVAAAAGIAALSIALRPLHARATSPAAEPEEVPGSGVRPTAGGPVDRRRFLVTSTAIGVLGVLGGGVGRWLRESRNVEAARARVAARLGGGPTRPPTGIAEIEVLDGEVAGISALVTPNADFYRIDKSILVPQLSPDDWSLRITGMVDHAVELTFDELLAMDRIADYVMLQCVSNEVGGDLVGNALWSGVPLADLLDLAGARPEASQIVGRSFDGWTAGFPREVVDDGRPAMVALTMNDEPLPARHGFPARLIVPGLYGYVSATKWLTEIELTTWEAFDGYWIDRGWAKEGPIKTQSRIDVPRSGATLRTGPTAVAGVAWAPTRSVDRVEVRVDEGPWQRARLSGALSESAWVQWILTWDATPGAHRLQVRATDGDGDVQTGEVSRAAPSGATGHHTITVEVST